MTAKKSCGSLEGVRHDDSTDVMSGIEEEKCSGSAKHTELLFPKLPRAASG
jgi:hypothetical protein